MAKKTWGKKSKKSRVIAPGHFLVLSVQLFLNGADFAAEKKSIRIEEDQEGTDKIKKRQGNAFLEAHL